MSNNPPTYYVYTDGSCYPNPGIGAWAYVIIDEKDTEYKHSGYVEDTTSNRMEVTAIINALEHIETPSKIVICSDSLYAINLTTYKSNINKDLRIQLFELMNKHTVTFKWVKGHSGDYYNDMVDDMAYRQLHKAYAILGKTGLSKLT